MKLERAPAKNYHPHAILPLENKNQADNRFNWSDYFHKLRFRASTLVGKFWWILLGCMAAGMVFMYLRETTGEPVYSSRAELIISGRIPIPEGSFYREELTNFFGNNIHVMQSERIQRAAAQRIRALHPEVEPVEIQLSVGQKMDASIFELVCRGKEPKYTQYFLQGVVDEFMKWRAEQRRTASKDAYLRLTREMSRLENEIDQSETAVRNFQIRHNVVFVREQYNSAGQRLVSIENSLADLKQQLRYLETVELDTQIQESLEAVSDNFSSLFEQNQLYLETRQQLDRIDAELREFGVYMKPKHPKIIALTRERDRLEKRLKIIEEQILERMDARRKGLRTRIANLEAERGEWEKIALEFSRLLAEFESVTGRLDRARETRERLTETLDTIERSETLDSEIISVFREPSEAEEVETQLGRDVAIGGFLGLALGSGLIYLLGRLDNRIFTLDDLHTTFDTPVLGMIPEVEKNKKKGKRVELLKPQDTRHIFSEACRNLRSSVMFLETGNGSPQTVGVSSSVPAEGKSTVAANLAIALSLANAKTLLIDADLRRGGLNSIFQLDRSPGLAEFLEHGGPIASHIKSTPYPHLDLIPGGNFHDRPAELFLSAELDRLLTEAKQQYQYVIVDTAPVLATDDTPTFASKLDCVLMAVRAGFSQVRQIEPSIERLLQRKSQIAGFVLNQVNVRESRYHYYKYFEYYALRGAGTDETKLATRTTKQMKPAETS